MRDRALLLVGFAGGFRRAELCALDVADIVLWNDDGIRILVRQSKTEQESEGLMKDIPHAAHPEFCPVHALRDWLDSAEIEAGPLFRPISKSGRVLLRRLTDRWVALLIKQKMLPVAEAQAERAWMRLSTTQRQQHDKAVWIAESVQRTVKRLAGHSLRAGFVTSAAAAGAR